MFWQAKARQMLLRGNPLDYIVFGTGKRSLILIQGLNTNGIRGSAVSLAWMYRRFARDYRVYLFDRRQDLFDGITVRDLASDVADAMDQLQLTQADVIGVSQGGMIAQSLAIDRPDLVRKLVLAVTLCRPNQTVETVIGNWINWTEHRAFKQLVQDMAERMYSEAYLRRYRPFLPLLTLLQTPKDIPRFITLAKACLTCQTYEELDRIQCPVFVIGAKRDRVVGGSASEELAQKLDCRLYLYETLGHAAYEEAPDFNEKIYRFLMET